MRLAETTSAESSNSKPAQQSKKETGLGVPEPFSMVLSATRERSRELMGLMSEHNQAVRARRDTCEQVDAKTHGREEQAAKADKQADNVRESANKPTRADRMKQAAGEEGRTSVKQESAKSSEETMQASPTPTHVEDHTSAGFAVDTPVTSYGADAIGGAADTTAGSTTAGVSESPDAAVTSIAGAAIGGALVGNASNTSAPASESTGAAATGSGTAVAPVAKGAGAGGQGGASETAEQSVTAAAAKATASSSRPASANNEFQQMLGQLARQRMGEPGRAEVATNAALKGKTAAREAQATVDMESPNAVNDLARVVRTQVGSRESTMTMDLSPAELGRMRIDVRMADGTVAVRFQAETYAGREAVRDRLDDLKSALAQQGIRIDRVDVESMPAPVPTPQHGDPNGDAQGDARQWQQAAESGQWQGGSQYTRQDPGARTDGTAVNGGWDAGSTAVALAEVQSATTGWDAQTGVDLVA